MIQQDDRNKKKIRAMKSQPNKKRADIFPNIHPEVYQLLLLSVKYAGIISSHDMARRLCAACP